MLGPVFRTYDAEHDRLVAVKVFRLDIVPEEVARLADALRRLVSGHATHAAIVAPIEAGLESSTAFLASEYVAAETLDVALRHLAPAPLSVAVPLLRAMAGAIDAAWLAGSAQGHGALHPRDVFVSPGSNDVRVSGFGVVPALESVGIKSPVRRPYTAPERSTTSGAAWDVRADVFSLGAIAHELLTGRRPAGPGEQDGALPSSITPEIRVRIRRVLSAALAERPAQRFSSARAFVDALEIAGTNDALPSLPFEAVEEAPASAMPVSREPADAPVIAGLPVMDVPTEPASRVDLDLDTTPAEPSEPSMFDLDDVMEIRERATESPMDEPGLRLDSVAGHITKEPTADRANRPKPLGVRDDARAMPTHDPDLSGLDFAETRAPTSTGSMLSSFGPAEPPPSSSSFSWIALLIMFVAGAVVGGVAVALFISGTQQPTVAPPAAVATPTQADASHPAAPPLVDTLPPGTDVPVTPPAQAPAPAVQSSAADKTSAPATPAVTTGRMNVRSTPTGANVSIDGKARGRTPLTIRELALGAHAVVVSHAGFAAETRNVTISPDAPASTITVELRAPHSTPAATKASAKTGALFVDTRPSGATVLLDGKTMGVTPLQVADVAMGSHTLRVSLAGYKPIETTVDVAAGDPTRFTVSLERTSSHPSHRLRRD